MHIAMDNRNFDRKKQKYAAPKGEAPDELAEGLIEGRNALTEALKSGRTIDKVYVAEGSTDRSLTRLAALAKEAGAVVVPVDRRKLDQMSPTGAHQGVIAAVAAHEYATLDDILALAEARKEAPLLVIQGEKDHTVQTESAQYIADHAVSAVKRVLLLPRAGHRVLLGVERKKAFSRIIEFLHLEDTNG